MFGSRGGLKLVVPVKTETVSVRDEMTQDAETAAAVSGLDPFVDLRRSFVARSPDGITDVDPTPKP